MPLIATKGAASAQGFGEFAQSGPAIYIEDVFSTYLYTGNGSNTNAIVNNIDISTKGGLIWTKERGAANPHLWIDTARVSGSNEAILYSNTTDAQSAYANYVTFNTNGYTISSTAAANQGGINDTNSTYASWTFRKQPKFFDIVTYTGNGTTQSISHTLGSTPGCVIVKSTSAAGTAWYVWHRSFTAGYYAFLNTTAAQTNANSAISFGNNTTYVDPTSTNFTVGSNGDMNDSGQSYVAYLFAHNAGGFGLTGSDNVISCGSYTGSGGTTTPNQINLGYEAQWVLVKPSSGVGNWAIADMMRGSWIASDGSANFNELLPNTSGAENANNYGPAPTATGFAVSGVGFPNASGVTYIYIAIRRGPMKTPTDATKVFIPNSSSVSSGTAITTNFPVDLQFVHFTGISDPWFWMDRLRGIETADTGTANVPYVSSNSTAAETTATNVSRAWNNTSFKMPSLFGATSTIFYNLRRAPGFFDVVCYTGTGSATTQTHNLGVAPELMITKSRSTAGYQWGVYVSSLGATKRLLLNGTNAESADSTYWNNTAPTSTVFTVATSNQTNASGTTYVAYLFASVSGVSKVGSYTGTGTTLQVNCGFTNGSRFVLIKRTDSTGDWYVWDSARGIVAGNDPYLLLNSTAAEVTNTDYVDTFSSGFEISSTAPAAINANGGTYIFLAIA